MNELAKPFVWQTKDRRLILPRDMETSHLFRAMRMIWNHTAPAPFQLPGGRYRLGPRFTPEYRRHAFIQLAAEWMQRPDKSAEHIIEHEKMKEWIHYLFPEIEW
jgi:hypothetical protein